MKIFENWLHAFFQARGLEKADGQMLFRYRTTQEEYQGLKGIFSERLAALNGSAWRSESSAEPALFVLYASEWWRREYDGGAWRWASIFESLTSLGCPVDQSDRSNFVESGLYVWRHRPSDEGKKYLGSIVAHGGLPLKLLARGDGVVSRLLLSATRKAQMLGWDEYQLIGFFESHREDLVQHLRLAEIYRLLTEMVMTVLSLRSDYKLTGVADPVATLEQNEPRWRERFPIAVADRSVEPLLVGLVREASRQIKAVTTYPVSVVRTLVPSDDTDSYALWMSLSMPSAISLEALASAVQAPPSKIPHSFVVELAGDHREPLGRGRLIDSQTSTVLLSGRPKRFLGKAACQEILLVLRSTGADIVSPNSVPGGEALDEAQPWVFVFKEETLTLVGVGSIKVTDATAYVLVPEHFKLVPGDNTSLDLIGLVEGLLETRWLHKLQGSVSILVGDDCYSVRTQAQSGSDEQLVWKGNRLWYHSSPFPVFQGVPRLYRLTTDGQSLPVAEREIEWVQALPKGERLVHLKTHRGPADAWLTVEGMRQRRFRMVLVAPDARIAFRSGATEYEGIVEFHGWGVAALHAPDELSPVRSGAAALFSLAMRAHGQPPSNVLVTAEWSPAWPVLHIELPFPATGGRFARANGSVLPNAASLTLKRAHEVHVQIFDQNPAAPKHYYLEIQLSGENQDNRMRRALIPLSLDDNGIGDLRFFEIESILNGLISQSDHLDACLDVNLLAGSTVIKTLQIHRYDVLLERVQQSLVIPETQLCNVSAEQLQRIELRAIPLLMKAQTPYELEQLKSEDLSIGRWSVATLPSGHSPWLVYPSKNSDLQIRPTLWTISPVDRLGTLQTIENTGCVLAKAMSLSSSEDRSRDLVKVVAAMAMRLNHPSWDLVLHHYNHIKHLPLSTLDYWRIIGRNQDACLVAALKFPSDIYELMFRMRDELGVMWEFTSLASLRRVYDDFSDYYLAQLGRRATREMVGAIVDSIFSKMCPISDSLAIQIDRILFEKSGKRTARFDRMLVEHRRTPKDRLQKMWQGEDAHLQRVLLRNHADDRFWPYFKIWEALIKEIEVEGDRVYVNFIRDLASQLIWQPPIIPGGSAANTKLDVVNAPLLTGFLIQTCKANKWLHAENHMSVLRQIKMFDPAWFELGLQTGYYLAMKAEESCAQIRRSE